MAGGQRPVRTYDAPPGHRSPEVRHHPTDQARATVSHVLGDRAVAGHPSLRDALDEREHRLDVLLRIHATDDDSADNTPLIL